MDSALEGEGAYKDSNLEHKKHLRSNACARRPSHASVHPCSC